MLVVIIVLAWLLINLLATIAFIIAQGYGIDGWGDYMQLLFWMVVSPWVCFGIGFIIKAIKRTKSGKKSEPKIYWAEYED